MFSQKSHNRKILANLLRKTRKNDTSNLNYFILYGFLYKYLSDRLKDHLMRNIAGDEGYLKTFYQTPEGIQDLRHIALSDLGYFIEDPSAYMDNHITDSIVEDIFSPRFFRLLNDNITFSDENRAKHYFEEIIGILSKQMDLYSLNINDEMNSFMNNYLFSLSKLDVFENDFTYAQAYDAIAYSIFGRLMSTPDYITDIISKIVFSQRKSRGNAYDPFLKDASILFNLKREGVAIDIYGKEKDELLYFYSIIKAFINELASCDFVDNRQNIVMIGNPGTGKTHLSIALGIKACMQGMNVKYTDISHLIWNIAKRLGMENGYNGNNCASFIVRLFPDLCKNVKDTTIAQNLTANGDKGYIKIDKPEENDPTIFHYSQTARQEEE